MLNGVLRQFYSRLWLRAALADNFLQMEYHWMTHVPSPAVLNVSEMHAFHFNYNTFRAHEILYTHTSQGLFVMKISTGISQVTSTSGSATHSLHPTQKWKLVHLHDEDLWFSCHPQMLLHRQITSSQGPPRTYHQVSASQLSLKPPHAQILKHEQKIQPAQQNTLSLVPRAGPQVLVVCISCHFLGYTGPAILHLQYSLKEYQGQM